MKLFSESGGFLWWLARVLGVFLRIRPLVTFFLIVSLASSWVTSLLASFLPLKTILLAASPGVPRYFPFVDPELKDQWILALGLGAVAAYFLTIALEALARKLADVGGMDVLKGANDVNLMREQATSARSYYSRICGIAAGLLFSVFLLAVLPILNLLVFQVVAGLLIALYLVTALLRAVSARSGLESGFSLLFEERLPGYLSGLSSLVFFCGLAVLLYPYLVGDGPNLLLTILAFLLLRQLLVHLTKTVRESVAVASSRTEIDPLVFPEHQLRVLELPKDTRLRQVFSKRQRDAVARDALKLAGIEATKLEAHWVDPILPRFSLFDVQHALEEGMAHYQMQAFPGAGNPLLGNEEFLFDFVPRERLLAPPVLARFTHKGYEIQVCKSGSPASVKGFKPLVNQLNLKIWQVAPPASLVAGFTRSKLLLAQRLDEGAMKRLEMAVDSEKDRHVFEKLRQNLPVLQQTLDALPLVVLNPAIVPRNVMEAGGETGHYVMTWGRWSLEPLGAGIPAGINLARIEELLAGLRESRADIDDAVTVEHVLLGQHAWLMDQAIARGALRAAMIQARKVVANSVLAADESHEPEAGRGSL